MTPEAEPDANVEIGHVLAMDAVDYSTLLITEQSRMIAELTRVVKETAIPPRGRRRKIDSRSDGRRDVACVL
jgi:hypothetical protein